MLKRKDISNFINENGLQNQVLSIHMAVRSLGEMEGDLNFFIDEFLAHGCTVMAPTHSWNFLLNTETNELLFNNKNIQLLDRQWNFQSMHRSLSADSFDVFYTKLKEQYPPSNKSWISEVASSFVSFFFFW